MAKSIFPVRLDEEDKQRIKAYLDATYKGSIAEFFRRVGFEKVCAWEAMQREEQRREAEHQAKLAQYGT